jgi:hypothetical protein
MGIPGPSSSRTNAISRFLAEHHDHDAGFDVRRDPGSGAGRLRIVCLGCGKSVEYRAADAAEISAGSRAQLERDASRPRKRQRPSGKGPAGSHPARRGEKSGPPVTGIAVGILIVAALVATGILILGGNDSSRSPSPATPTTVVTRQVASPPTPPPAPQPKAPPRRPSLHPATFFNQFSLGVPGSWQHEQRGTETVLLGPGGSPEVDAYFAQGSRSLADLGSSAVRFLRDRHPDGHVTSPHPTRVGNIQGLQINATFPHGTETAFVLTSGSFSYLLVKRIATGDDLFRIRQAAAAVDSFRPQ